MSTVRSSRDRLVVARFLAGPITYAIDQITSYMLVRPAARASHKLALHGVALGAFVITCAVTYLSWRAYTAIGHPDRATDPERARRDRFLAAGGIGLGGMSVLLVVATEIPNVLLRFTD